MHLFPTTLAILECSSINSESQSRPLAIRRHRHHHRQMIQQHLSTRRDQNSRKSQRTKGERHEQERCDRRHETTQGRISVSGIRDILENVGLRSTDLNRCNNDILTGSKNQRGRIAPLQCVRLSAPCHTPRGRGAGARTNGGSVRPSGKAGRFRPQANPNQKTAACSGINRAHVCTRGVSRLPRGSNFAQTGRRLDKKDAEGTLELDPGVSGSSPRLLPSLDLSLYYDLLLVLPEARGIGRPGLPASLQLECHAC